VSCSAALLLHIGLNLMLQRMPCVMLHVAFICSLSGCILRHVICMDSPQSPLDRAEHVTKVIRVYHV
jgi:hypothetical protein